MYWTDDCVWAAAPMTFGYLKGECEELLEEIRKRRVDGIVDEFGDVMYCLPLWLANVTGKNLPMPFAGSTIMKHKHRIVEWKKIFKKEGLEFKYHYLKYGSNWKNRLKVMRALRMARTEQELLAYNMPMEKIIESQSIEDV